MRIFLLIFAIFFFINCISQEPTFIRFGNTKYYRIDDFSKDHLEGSSSIYGDDIEQRYIDIYFAIDSIPISFPDTSYYFSQKEIEEPSNKKELIFYNDRDLKSNFIKIKSMKLQQLKSDSLFIRARIKNTNTKQMYYENVKISTAEIDGVFLGPGKTQRRVVYGVSISALIIGIIVVLV